MYNNITKDDYSFVDNNLNEMWAIELKTKYEGVVYCYGKVTASMDEIEEETGDGLATLSFQYQIIDAKEYDQEMLESDENFNNYIGDVLRHVIDDAFANDNYRIGDDESDTNHCAEKSVN